jgi:hypothetical protein
LGIVSTVSTSPRLQSNTLFFLITVHNTSYAIGEEIVHNTVSLGHTNIEVCEMITIAVGCAFILAILHEILPMSLPRKSYSERVNVFPEPSWRTFEFDCAALLESMGYKDVTVTQAEKDGGKDIVARNKKGETVYIECKQWNPQTGYQVGQDVLQKLVGACVGDDVKEAICITTTTFTTAAIKYADRVPIKLRLIDGEQLERILKMAS